MSVLKSIQKYISIKLFFISFVVGMIVQLFAGHLFTISYIYPYSIDNQMIQDKSGNCFTYSETRIACPKNAKQIESIRPHHGGRGSA